MNKLLAALFAIISISTIAQQAHYPKGAYLNATDLLRKKPSGNYEAIASKHGISTSTNMPNAYQISVSDQTIPKNFFTNDVFAWSTGDSVFINCHPKGKVAGYVRVSPVGNLLLFTTTDDNCDDGVALKGNTKGLYMLDWESGLSERVTLDQMQYVLAYQPEVWKQYKNESFFDHAEVKVKYLKEVLLAPKLDADKRGVNPANLMPKGAYMTLVEFQHSTPGQQYEAAIIKRTNGDIEFNGGNDYKLLPADIKLDKKIFKKKVYAYSTGDELYINCAFQKAQPWFAKGYKKGNHVYFMGGVGDGVMINAAVLGGAIGGAMAALKRYAYDLDISTGVVTRLDPTMIRQLLASRPDLLEKYNKEKRDGNDEVIMKYIYLLD